MVSLVCWRFRSLSGCHDTSSVCTTRVALVRLRAPGSRKNETTSQACSFCCDSIDLNLTRVRFFSNNAFSNQSVLLNEMCSGAHCASFVHGSCRSRPDPTRPLGLSGAADGDLPPRDSHRQSVFGGIQFGKWFLSPAWFQMFSCLLFSRAGSTGQQM